jgi:hypothetical protein
MGTKLAILETSLNTRDLVGSEVLTAVVVKSTIFWDITPCSLLSVNRGFGGTYRLHLFATCFHAGLSLNLFFLP